MKKRTLISLSGATWLFIGSMLLYKGLRMISIATILPKTICSTSQDPQQTATFFIALGMLVGFFKGRFVLSKTVERVTQRILSLTAPISWKNAYAKSYWVLMGSMMMLGLFFRFLPIGLDIRGSINVAIGSALVNGAMLYFRKARSIYGTGSLSQSQ